MTFDSQRPAAGPHAAHDRLLVAAHAAGDLIGPDRRRAEQLVMSCEGCAALASELRAITAATRHLPPAALPAGRDFRLTAEQAAGLRRGGLLRRLLQPFRGGSGSAVRPLAGAFTTLGVAGLLLAAMPGFLGGTFLGAGGAAPMDRQSAEHVESADPLAGEQNTGGGPTDLATQEPGTIVTDGSGNEFGGKDTSGGEPSAAPAAQATEAPDRVTATSAPDDADEELFAAYDDAAGATGPSPLVLLSVGFLGAGIGLFLLRTLARRLG